MCLWRHLLVTEVCASPVKVEILHSGNSGLSLVSWMLPGTSHSPTALVPPPPLPPPHYVTPSSRAVSVSRRARTVLQTFKCRGVGPGPICQCQPSYQLGSTSPQDQQVGGTEEELTVCLVFFLPSYKASQALPFTSSEGEGRGLWPWGAVTSLQAKLLSHTLSWRWHLPGKLWREPRNTPRGRAKARGA